MGRRVAIALVLALVVVAPAAAGPPGTWTAVTDSNGRNIDEVSVQRTTDNVLHVVWRFEAGSLNEGVKHAPITAAGQLGATSTVASGFSSVVNPYVLIAVDGSLQVFFPGLTSPDERNGIQLATAGPDGASWSLFGKVSNARNTGNTGAGIRSDGVPVFAWAAGTQTYVHAGTNQADADIQLGPSPKCCFYDPDLATDIGGQTFVAYFSNADGQPGIFVQEVFPALGTPQLAPGSLTNGQILSPSERTPIVRRVEQPGLLVGYCGGYPTCTRALVWRIGAGAPIAAGKGGDIENVNVGQAPDGRVWAFWSDGGTDRIFATRSNRAATRFGAVVSIAPPQGTDTVWNLEGDGLPGPLDVLAHVTAGGSTRSWHTQVLPGLSVSCKGGKGKATCTVTDAGEAVAGAKVKIGGKTATTSASGKASAALKPGRYTARASRAGYSAGSARVRVR